MVFSVIFSPMPSDGPAMLPINHALILTRLTAARLFRLNMYDAPKDLIVLILSPPDLDLASYIFCTGSFGIDSLDEGLGRAIEHSRCKNDRLVRKIPHCPCQDVVDV